MTEDSIVGKIVMLKSGSNPMTVGSIDSGYALCYEHQSGHSNDRPSKLPLTVLYVCPDDWAEKMAGRHQDFIDNSPSYKDVPTKDCCPFHQVAA